jgi:hypothetical protein
MPSERLMKDIHHLSTAFVVLAYGPLVCCIMIIKRLLCIALCRGAGSGRCPVGDQKFTFTPSLNKRGATITAG